MDVDVDLDVDFDGDVDLNVADHIVDQRSRGPSVAPERYQRAIGPLDGVIPILTPHTS